MDNDLQHLQISPHPPQRTTQRPTSLSASASNVMDALSPTEAHFSSPTSSSSYCELFAQISALQAKGDYHGLIQAAERADIVVCLRPSSCYRTSEQKLDSTHPQITHDNHSPLLVTIPLVL